MPSHLGDESPRETNATEAVDEDAKVLLLELKGAHSKISSNLLSMTQE
jgi:hypothetical protein